MADDKALKAKFQQDLQTAKKYMEPIHQLMDRYYKMYRNQWSDNTDDFQISDLYAYVETVTPILTNNRVRASVHSDYPEYVNHAEGMTDILDHTYDINDWDYEAQEIARMAEIYRSAIAYTGYDTEYKNSTGKLCVKGINIRWCYLDPAPTKFEDSSFFFFVEPKRKSEVLKMYPDKKKQILDSVGKSENGGFGNKSNWFKSWINTMKTWVTFNSDNTRMNQLDDYQSLPELTEEEKRKNSVAFIHYWYRDDDDKWRVSYWADDVLLEDMANPFWHECLPYDIYNPTKDVLSSMGIPMGEHIENLNYEKNVMMDLIIQSAKRAVDPILLYNTAAGLKDPQALREKARDTGTIGINNPDFVPLNAIAEYFVSPGLQNFVIDLPDRFQSMEDRLSGVNDSFRGMSEATSGKEVQLKQEAAYTRIKTKIDNFERFNKSIAEKIIVNAMQFYKETRAFRIKGDYSKYDGMQQDNAPFDIQPIQNGVNPDTQEPTFDRSEFFMYANPNEWTQLEQGVDESQPTAEVTPTKDNVQQAFKVLQFTVEIEAGSSLPTSRMARREEASELFKEGAIDQESLLDVYDWPHREDIIKRMKEAAQAQQEAQMQQQQMQMQAQQQQQQAQMEQQMQMKQMEMQHQASMNQANNQTKMQQTQAKQQPDIASTLDAIRQAVPELANASDEQLLHLVANMKKAGLNHGRRGHDSPFA